MIDLIFWRANSYDCYKRYPARWNRIIRGLRNGLLESNAKSIKFRVTVSPTYNSVASRADDVQSMHVAARPFDQGRSSFTSHLPRGILMDLPYTRICVQSLYLRVVSNLLSLALT